ncbi:MAG: hypothetical protein QOG68_2697 [Solirubrobacteraceae bacterium]|nr:hypothetical protein [Solirubrobacteraceae bacterium]
MSRMVRCRLMLSLAVVSVLAAAAPAPAKRTPAPQLVQLRCLPFTSARCANGPAAAAGHSLQLRGHRLYSGMRVSFHWSAGTLSTVLLRTSSGYVVRVPAGIPPGAAKVSVRDRTGRRSAALPMQVLEGAKPTPAPTPPATTTALPAPFAGNGMWIWELGSSDHGDAAAIGARARAAGMTTVFVKSADGTNVWSQFSPALVAALHAQGLQVCGWQFLYGSSPGGEAKAGAVAAANGADCMVLDPETAYEGRYASAQRYMDLLRAAVGEDFPIGLASFPYVDYHPGLPYSVFLGPGNAQVDAPQTYWKAIGGGVGAVSAHTFAHNRIYNRPLAPLGQSYGNPSAWELQRFRQIWAGYGAQGISWWSWQSTSAATWVHLGDPLASADPPADPGWPALQRKAKGDEVVWLQQHLASDDPSVTIDGAFGPETDAALRAFQTNHGLPATGVTDAATWAAVLALPVRLVDWAAKTRSAPRAVSAGLRSHNELGRSRYAPSPSTSRTP